MNMIMCQRTPEYNFFNNLKYVYTGKYIKNKGKFRLQNTKMLFDIPVPWRHVHIR